MRLRETEGGGYKNSFRDIDGDSRKTIVQIFCKLVGKCPKSSSPEATSIPWK